METRRDDFGIAIRSAFLKKGAQQRFSLFALIVFSIILLFIETIETKPLNYLRSVIKDTIYRGSVIVSSPFRGLKITAKVVQNHINLYSEYSQLKEENDRLKDEIYDPNFLIFENRQLRKLLFFAPYEIRNVKFNLILPLSKTFDCLSYKLQTTKFFDLY